MLVILSENDGIINMFMYNSKLNKILESKFPPTTEKAITVDIRNPFT